MEDYPQAISFANSYFSLVDGLAKGFECHLSENVVLDWFGKIIRGKNNVAQFMKIHKANSRHVFNNIEPTQLINYRKYQTDRQILHTKMDNHVSSLAREGLNFERLSINDSVLDPENNNVLVKGPAETEEENKIPKINNEVIYEMDDYSLGNLFEFEIKTSRGEEGEMVGKNSIVDEFVKKSKKSIEDNSAIKYIEANGQIEFSKKSYKRGTDFQTWRRQSRLQIAYSLINRSEDPRIFRNDDKSLGNEDNFIMETDDSPGYDNKKYSQSSARLLPSLREITEISNKLVPNINNFGGYFSSIDFTAERDNFLDNFHAELAERSSASFLRTPQYVDDRLVFTEIHNNQGLKESKDEQEAIKLGGNNFVFNYLIHLIVYQGNSKCRRSLNEEFEFSNKNNQKSFPGEKEQEF